MSDSVDLDAVYRELEREPSIGALERYEDGIAVHVGLFPVCVSADFEQRRLAVWTTIAEVAPAGAMFAAKASNAYNRGHYHETGIAMAASVERSTIYLGRSLDAQDLRPGTLAAVLREVEKHRRVAEACLSEAELQLERVGTAPAHPEEDAAGA